MWKRRVLQRQWMKEGKRVLLVILASVLYAFSIKIFVNSGDLYPGGFAGLTVLLQRVANEFLGKSAPFAPLYIVFNIIPLVISYRYIGKKFTWYTCLSIILTSVLTDIIPSYTLTTDVWLVCIFGGILSGFAVSLCLMADASTGGTDLLAIYFANKKGIDTFHYVLAANALLLMVAGFLFGWEKALYSIIFQFQATEVIQLFYKRYRKNTLLIVTDKPLEVTKTIYQETGHGATSLNAHGTYASENRTMIYSVVASDEVKRVTSAVHKVDENAFINVMKTEHIEGKFYLPKRD